MPPDTKEGQRPLRAWLWRLLPWVVTAGVLVVLLRQYSFEAIAAEVWRRDAWPLLPLAVGSAFLSLALVAAADTLILRTCLGQPRYWDVFRGKGGTSLLAVLSYGFGHGGYGVWVARKTGADLRTTLGIILYIMLSDLAGVCLVAAAAIWVADPDLPSESRTLLATLAPLAGLGLVAIGLVGRPLVAWLVADSRLLVAWARMPAPLYLLNLVGRGLIISVYVVATWIGGRIFGLDLPLEAVASYMPVIMLVGSLPFSVAGFGAVQAAWLLFEPWAPGARILAFQFLFHAFGMVGLLIRGLPFLPGVLREIRAGPAEDHKVTQRS
jgi:uncharacterized membrane protein YbhN (UPF0104 family)